MNPTRPAHSDDESFDPRWWLVPATLVATAMLVALGGYLVLHDTQQVAALTPPLHDLPSAPQPSGELPLPLPAAAEPGGTEPQEQPPTF